MPAHAARAIWVHPGRDRADVAATLAHELAHAETHAASAALPRGVREVVAESVAYAVCSRFGLDLSLRSASYVAGWLDDPDAFKAGMAAIHDGAASLIDAADTAEAREPDVSAKAACPFTSDTSQVSAQEIVTASAWMVSCRSG